MGRGVGVGEFAGTATPGTTSVLIALILIAAGFLLAAGWTYQRAGLRRDATALPPPGRLIALDGHRLHALVLGEGSPAVVFEAGIAASSLNWRTVQERVAGFTRTWAYDRPGFGWSEPGPGRPTAGACAARLRAALAAAGLDAPYILVGHSFGGYVVQVFAARHAADVAGVVLVDSITASDWEAPSSAQRRELLGGRAFARVGALLAWIGVVRLALHRLRGGAPGIGRAVLGAFGATAVTTVTRVVGEVTKLRPELLPAVQAHWSRPESFRTMARHFEALPESAREVRRALETSPRWSFPLVVLTAGSCTPAQFQAQRELADRSGAASHVVVDCGHWLHLDRPDAVVDAIREIVDSFRGSRPTAART